MHSFENGAFIANIGARHQSKTPDKSGTEIGDDIAIEIFQQQHVVLVRVHDQLHAGIVDDVFSVRNLGVFLGYVARAAQEQAVRELHDVGLVDGVNLLALVFTRVFESETRYARGRLLGNNLEAFDHTGHDLMLDSGIQTFGVLADDDQVDIGITRRDMRKVADGTEVRVKLKALAEFDIDAGESATDGSGHGPF